MTETPRGTRVVVLRGAVRAGDAPRARRPGPGALDGQAGSKPRFAHTSSVAAARFIV